MAIITTYVCDVSGKQGAKEEFVKVSISSQTNLSDSYHTKKTIEKVVHMDVARKLNLLNEKTAEPQPEPTLESKLVTLLKDFVSDIAYEAASEAASNRP